MVIETLGLVDLIRDHRITAKTTNGVLVENVLSSLLGHAHLTLVTLQLAT